ncbi:MAG: AMP-binding protein [Hyphomicrobiales bacterium]|nr:AMP-binding protein [Hyphomicrobiales bacterium]MCP5371618.1 AMP-binding protein [Hyphomicrobiales bacterium]
MTSADTRFAWTPPAETVAAATLTAFMAAEGVADLDRLIARADADPAWYWDAVMRHMDIRFTTPYDQVLDTSQGIQWPRWCRGGRTNLTLNCLDRHRGTAVMDKEAVVWEGEDGTVRAWTYTDLDIEVCRLAEGLRGLGLGRGDAVGLFMPMLPETVAAFFAVAKIGAIVLPLFSGFGAEALVSRLNDGGAKAVLCADGTRRRGKTIDMKATLDTAARSVPSLEHVVVLDILGLDMDWHTGRDHRWHALGNGIPASSVTEDMPADDPFMVIFTSGTTGKAKGTVHTHCGFMAKAAADIGLVGDFKSDDRFLWMSDIGWLVGPMQIAISAFRGATLVLAEGTPDYPETGRLWRLVQDHRLTYLGLAPTIARAMMAHGTADLERYDTSSLRLVMASGELWNPDSWWWTFDNLCRRRVPIINVSGGTEIGWGILSNTVIQPHKPCGLSSAIPGMGADIALPDGSPAPEGTMGELVLRVPSIGLSRGLWNDPDKFLETYWSRIPGLWVHGDWASRDGDGTWYLHGRSDDTIMVAGKRCGPSEVESLLMETGLVAEAAATATTDPVKGEAVLCVCVPRPDRPADAAVAEDLRAAVVASLGPAFRPKDVVFVSDLPKTRSMKVMRRVIRAVYEGRDPGDLASLVNPESVAELARVTT